MDNLKYLALTYVDLNDKLTIQEKNQLGNFLSEANEDQIAYLLVEGEMLEESELSQAALSALERAKVSKSWEKGYEYGQDVGVKMGATGGLAAAAVAALVITTGYKVYKRFLSKAARSCKNLGGDAKTSCMVKYKRDALKAQVSELIKGKAKCGKSNDRGKCVEKLNRKINSVKSKLGAG